MKANATPLLNIFENRLQLEVPLFQRQYVWKVEEHWAPLWEDISRKFTEYLEGRHDSPVHFLGAMVLDQKQQPVTHVPKRQVIDGQQRLTTFQLFLAALRDFARTEECEEIAKECEAYTENRGMMSKPDVDRFKVWPTQADRPVFQDVMLSGSREELEKRHPLKRPKYARKPSPRPTMVEAYLFFYDQLTEFFVGTATDPPLKAECPLGQRLGECFLALKNALQIVAIDLEQGDDAQVIFETLNARGEPLLPADLLRNYIFLRAARQGESQEELYARYWSQFDHEFWRKPIKQGRLKRPRSDLFLQHFLASHKAIDIPIKHLFAEYKHWITGEPPKFGSVEEELATIARQGAHFRRILEPSHDDPLYGLSRFLDAFDIRTAYPLLLALLDSDPGAEVWAKVSLTLESYLVRRAVCGLTTKNLNRIFLSLTRGLRREGITADNLITQLLAQKGDSVVWPDDASFMASWKSTNIYGALNNAKLVHVLKRVSDSMGTSKMETVELIGPLSIEHIMPQSWHRHWPLEDGSGGVTPSEREALPEDDPRIRSSLAREGAVQTFGNLTIITAPLNSSISNGPWADKREKLLENTLLPINHSLRKWTIWNEETIAERGAELATYACKTWPRGASTS